MGTAHVRAIHPWPKLCCREYPLQACADLYGSDAHLWWAECLCDSGWQMVWTWLPRGCPIAVSVCWVGCGTGWLTGCVKSPSYDCACVRSTPAASCLAALVYHQAMLRVVQEGIA